MVLAHQALSSNYAWQQTITRLPQAKNSPQGQKLQGSVCDLSCKVFACEISQAADSMSLLIQAHGKLLLSQDAKASDNTDRVLPQPKCNLLGRLDKLYSHT